MDVPESEVALAMSEKRTVKAVRTYGDIEKKNAWLAIIKDKRADHMLPLN